MGSGLVADTLGFMFQDRGQLFSLRPALLAQASSSRLGRAIPTSTRRAKGPSRPSSPASPRGGGQPWMSFGVMGGDMQPQGQTRIILDRVAYGLDRRNRTGREILGRQA